MAPADFDIARSKSELASRRALLDTYRTAAREVHEGQYKNRQQVDRVMTWNLVHSQPMFAMGQPPQEVMEIVASPPEPAGKGDALWILIRSWPGESNQAPTVEFRTVSGDGPRWEGRLDELTAKLKQLHSDLAGRTQPVWVVNSDRPWTGPVRDVLKSLLDAGFDYRRVMFDMEEPQFRELEGQFTGRLRLFSLRSPAARTKAAVPIPDQPLEAHPDETPKTKTSVFDKSGPDLPDPTKIDGPVSKSLPPLNGPPTNDRKKSP